MVAMPASQIPLRWEPEGLASDAWISVMDLWIDRYPTFYSVYRDGRHKPGVQVYWLQDDFVICPNIWLNYYKSRVLAPIGTKPTGILITSPEHVFMRGEAVISTPQDSTEVEAIAARIEPMIIALGAKIDALE